VPVALRQLCADTGPMRGHQHPRRCQERSDPLRLRAASTCRLRCAGRVRTSAPRVGFITPGAARRGFSPALQPHAPGLNQPWGEVIPARHPGAERSRDRLQNPHPVRSPPRARAARPCSGRRARPADRPRAPGRQAVGSTGLPGPTGRPGSPWGRGRAASTCRFSRRARTQHPRRCQQQSDPSAPGPQPSRRRI